MYLINLPGNFADVLYPIICNIDIVGEVQDSQWHSWEQEHIHSELVNGILAKLWSVGLKNTVI